MMRRFSDTKEVFNRLLREEDKVVFNLFYLIDEGEHSYWATDDKTCIIGQSSPQTPLWMWLKDKPDEKTASCISHELLQQLALNTCLKVTASTGYAEGILDKVFQASGIAYLKHTPMTVYACHHVSNFRKASGKIVMPREEHRDILERFITGMVDDIEKRPMAEGEAGEFAEAVIGSDRLFLWEDSGCIVSMAMIAHRTSEFARINTVYTDHKYRGRGYAGTLTGIITAQLLEEGILPVLYTETDNPCSNAAYIRAGYEKYGELTEYRFQGGCL